MWIDNKGPSAPVITGGSSEYALSRTISVSTAADDAGASGVAYYEYYKKPGSDKPDASVEGTKVTTSTTSQKFDTNIAGDYVFFRAVDVVGNKGAWSDGQQVCIDINEPTVNAKNGSVTIKKGDNVEISTYFTTDKNGNAAISSTTYTIGSTSYNNTSDLEVGTYTVTCTVTKVTGKTTSADMTLNVESLVPDTETVLYTNSFDYSDPAIRYDTYATFTVPEGVEVLKFSITISSGQLNYNGYSIAWLSFGRGGAAGDYYHTKTYGDYASSEGYGTKSFYVGVTSGKEYTVRFSNYRCAGNINILYSQAINKTTVSVTDY